MTRSEVIRIEEQRNRRSNTNSRIPLVSEETSRMTQQGIRLRPILGCFFVVLALCLLLSDSFRLAISAKSSQVSDAGTAQVRTTQPVHRVEHARIKNAKRHSGA